MLRDAGVRLGRVHRDDSGVTSIEYGIAAALIAAVVSGAVRLLGEKVTGSFDLLNSLLT